jgi:peptidoglycan LD-endopeptidase LytH
MPLRRHRLHRHVSRPALVAVVGAALLADPLVPLDGAPAAAQTLDDLESLEDEAAGLQAGLAAATERYEATWAAVEALRVDLEVLRADAATLEAEVATTWARLGVRARSAYMLTASNATVELVLGAQGSQHAVERAALLDALQRRDRVDIDVAVAQRDRLARARALITGREAELVALLDQLEQQAAELSTALARVEAEAGELRTFVARQRRIDRGAQQGVYACIFDRGTTRFTDTWGYPRSGGRRHRGTDVFASYQAPVYAFTSGVVQRHSRSALGGISLYLRGDDGNVYFYAHLDSIEPDAHVGRRVVPGDLLARNGSTGNASRSAPHVHFELHPGGGSAVNPYPWLAAACL